MADRAASEVLSFALVFALVITSVTVVSVGGLDSLQSARNAEQLNNAERAYDVLADNMRDVHQRGAPSRATEISLGSAELYTGENVTIRVSAHRASGGWDNVTREVRPLIYQAENERRLVYEAGAVFRTNREGGLVHTPPPHVFRSDRALINVVATRSESVESLGDSTVLVRANARSRSAVIHDEDGSYDEVYVNVTSPRRNRWAQYFRNTPLTEHETGTSSEGPFVTYRLDSPPNRLHVVVNEIAISVDW